MEKPMSIAHPSEYSVGVISDQAFMRAERVKGWKHKPRSYRDLPRPVKPVHHVKKVLRPILDTHTFLRFATLSSGGSPCLDEKSRTDVTTPMAWISERLGTDFVKTFLDNLPSDVSSETFIGCDWFALQSEFNEALDNLVPNSFFAGESIVEGGIFIDALRLVLNPKKALIGFFTDVKERHLRRKTLAELDHYYRKLFVKNNLLRSDVLSLGQRFGIPLSVLKEGVNADLLYKFGVKPAIGDIRRTLSAHASVEQRLLHLNRYRGQYIPIRVKKTTSKEVFDYAPPGAVVDVTRHLREKSCVSSIFGMGRVRTDINEASKFRAYAEYFGLNKIVGTAWELIPFSFVVDWFTNAQERINDLTRIRLGEGPFMNLVALGSSVKKVLTYEALLSPGFDLTYRYDLLGDSQFPLFRCEISDYVRTPSIPDTSGVVDMSTLGLFHGVTGLELLVQRL